MEERLSRFWLLDMKIDRGELSKFAGYLGLALLVGGYIRYLIQELMTTLNMVLLIAGGALLLISIIFNFREIVATFSGRSAKLGANTLVLAIGVIVILAVLNFAGYRHHSRLDVTAEQLNTLSDQTRKIVSGLQKDVEVIKFSEEDDPRLADMMKEYRDLSGRISYKRIDPKAKPELAKQYEITRPGEVVVAADVRKERPQDVNEQDLTNAILKVTREGIKKIYFLEGHGEHGIDANDGEGLSAISEQLKRENYEPKSFNLASKGQMPDDCDVLVIAGPKQSLLPGEPAAIGKYLEGGGKALILIDPDTDPQLDEVLRAWSIEVDNDTVLDVSALGRAVGGPTSPLGVQYGTHPITKDFQRSMTIFPLARSIRSADSSASGVSTTDLVKTSEASWGETDKLGSEEVRLDRGKDKEGPLTIAIAASKPVGNKEARLVVAGDSDFATNQYVGAARNPDLVMNSLNWLAQDEDLISIRPKSAKNRRVTMSDSDKNLVFWLTLVLMPAAVIGSGVYIWWKRK